MKGNVFKKNSHIYPNAYLPSWKFPPYSGTTTVVHST